MMRLFQHASGKIEKNGSRKFNLIHCWRSSSYYNRISIYVFVLILIAGPLTIKIPFEVILGDAGYFGVDEQKHQNPNEFVELILVQRALTEEEIHEVWTYLQHKYQFETPLVEFQ
jgi:hypothetical protein